MISGDYMSAADAADKWEISRREVLYLCSRGRVDGAFKIGKSGMWLIPKDTEKPIDGRLKLDRGD